MGCDIHMHVEIRENNEWHYFQGDHFSLSDWEKEYTKKSKGNVPFDWRHYKMFGVLAGVRGEAIPIKEATYSLPEDVSDAVKLEWENDEGHSISHLTARDLYEFDYDKDIDTLTNKRRILFEKIKEKKWKYDSIDETYYDALGGPDSMFFTHVKELSELGDLDDVRIVFWFDN